MTAVRRAVQVVAGLPDVSMATAGDYCNFRLEEGRRVSHFMDPRTGWPIERNRASACVVHPSCGWADAYATALMAPGPVAACDFAIKNNLAVYLVIREDDGKWAAKYTPAFKPWLDAAKKR